MIAKLILTNQYENNAKKQNMMKKCGITLNILMESNQNVTNVLSLHENWNGTCWYMVRIQTCLTLLHFWVTTAWSRCEWWIVHFAKLHGNMEMVNHRLSYFNSRRVKETWVLVWAMFNHLTWFWWAHWQIKSSLDLVLAGNHLICINSKNKQCLTVHTKHIKQRFITSSTATSHCCWLVDLNHNYSIPLSEYSR